MTTVNLNPIEIGNNSNFNGYPSIKFNDKAKNTKWEIKTNTNEELTFNNTNINESIKISPTSGTMKLKGSTNYVTMGSPSTLSSNYNFIFPTNAPSSNQVMMFNGSEYTWENLFETLSNTVNVTKNPNPNEFGSIAEAIDYINNLVDPPS